MQRGRQNLWPPWVARPERGGKMANGKTLSVIAGTTACNGRCPFCISKTTPFQGMTPKPEQIGGGRFEKACELAKKVGIDTVLITGKGELTLHPSHISQYLEYSRKFKFSNVELQTNALVFGAKPGRFAPDLLVKKYSDWQRRIIENIKKATGLPLMPSDVVMLATLNKGVQLTPEQEKLVAKYRRGDGYRFCLTPYFLKMETQRGEANAAGGRAKD